MAAAKDNVNTTSIALISLVGVVLLVLIILATDGAYAWTESMFGKGNEAGDSTHAREQKAEWTKGEKAPSNWVTEDGVPERKYFKIPLDAARDLVLKERK